MERAQWIAFKKEARARDPLGSKLDYRYYNFLRAAYWSQSEGHPTLDLLLVTPPPLPDSDGQCLEPVPRGASEEQDDTTHHMPSPLKGLKKKATKSKRSKRTKAELTSARETSKNIMNMVLGFSDTCMTYWGRGLTLVDSYLVSHSARDKDLVSEAGVAYMEEKGIFISDRISKGMVFGAMLTWYHGVPLNDIRKKSKAPLFKRTGGILRRIPLLGRLFGRNKKAKTHHTLEDYENGTE